MLKELIDNPKVLNIYQWGSRVYGCYTDKSDYDYNVIVTDDYKILQDNIEIENHHFNFYKLSEFEEMIKLNRIEALESVFITNEFKIKETIKFNLKVNLIELRKSISKVCSNSYDKCRKKLTIEKDFNPYIAKKSLWHCIRILLFGIQCAKYDKIIDYTEANKYYNDIVLNESNDWLYYKENWHLFCNNLRTEFRKYTEKEWRIWKELNS
jgi:predicted nucleotidyltransferase